MKHLMPWWIKIILKIVFSRLPVNYSRWSKLSIFRHGSMDTPEYAFKVAEKHFNRTSNNLDDNFICMEIGPGDSLLSAFCMSAFGASKIFLVDVGDFADKNLHLYSQMFNYIETSTEFKLVNREITGDVDIYQNNEELANKIIKNLNAHYLTDGINSLESISDDSLDLIWSQAVLEHISLDEFDRYMAELYRILKFGGVSSHRVDLKDHLSGGLKNLFFSARHQRKCKSVSTLHLRNGDVIKK